MLGQLHMHSFARWTGKCSKARLLHLTTQDGGQLSRQGVGWACRLRHCNGRRPLTFAEKGEANSRGEEPLIKYSEDLRLQRLFSNVEFVDTLKPKEEEEEDPAGFLERPGRERPKKLSPGMAILSSFMCGGYGWLAYLVMFVD